MRRRNTRLAAQILAQDSAFERDPLVHGMVWATFGSIRKIAAMRNIRDTNQEIITVQKQRCAEMIDELQLLNKSSLSRNVDSPAFVSLVGNLNAMLHLLSMADTASTLEELDALNRAFTTYRDAAHRMIEESVYRESRAGIPLKTAELNRLEQAFDARAAVLQNDIQCDALWRDSLSKLEELTDKLSLGAAAKASGRMLEIKAAAMGIKKAGLLVIIGLMLLMTLLILLFRRYIVQPIINASKGLEAVHSGSGRVEIPEARILELHAIGDSVERFGRALEQIKENNVKLKHQSRQDGLTGIANRRSFDEKYEQEWNRGRRTKRPLSLLLIDIDFFKQFNDTYGHQQGGRGPDAGGRNHQGVSKRSGDFTARYGGEEFVMVLPETDSHGALAIADSIHRSIADLGIEHQTAATTPRLTVSIGVATVIPNDTIPKEALLKQADQALLKSKRSGKNTTCATI